MERIRLLRNTYLVAYLRALREHDIDPRPYLRAQGIPQDFEFLDDYMLAAALLHRFIQDVVALRTPGSISLEAGFHNAAHQSNPFSDSIWQAVSLADAISRHNENVVTYSPENRFDLKIEGEVGRWRKLGRSPNRETEIFCVASLIGHVRKVTVEDWLPADIVVAVADPVLLRELPALKGVKVTRLSRHSTIAVPTDLLSRPIGSQRQARASILPSRPTAEDLDFLATLRLVMKAYARVGNLSVDNIATATNTSRRTLQRRINRLGLSYSVLADQVRFEVASTLLMQKRDLGVTEIGFELGYRDPGSFSRAFRRYAGMAPTTYRHRFASESPSAV